MIEILDPATGRPRTIIELFLRLGVDDLAAIQSAGDADALQRATHKLKGTAAILGLRRLAAASGELDDAARADFDVARALIPTLVEVFEATCEALRAELQLLPLPLPLLK